MFNFFKKPKRNNILFSENLRNGSRIYPSLLFAQCGSELNGLWQDLVEGENNAVLQYQEFRIFLSNLHNEVSVHSFELPMLSVENELGDKQLSLTRGQIAYLSAFDFDSDIFLSDQEQSDSYILSPKRLQKVASELTPDEINYRNKIIDYFTCNIEPKVNKVANRIYDINICRYKLPLNTAEYLRYHKYIAGENYDFDKGKLSKWNYIHHAPIYGTTLGMLYESRQDNPIIPSQINIMNADILDCLCYINIALPTLNLLRVLQYRDEKDSVKESLENHFGIGVVSYMERFIANYSCAEFRKWVSMGLMVK
nr:MAG TPA: hypothetical protein [Caudoviricetes sp.]